MLRVVTPMSVEVVRWSEGADVDKGQVWGGVGGRVGLTATPSCKQAPFPEAAQCQDLVPTGLDPDMASTLEVKDRALVDEAVSTGAAAALRKCAQPNTGVVS